MAIIKFPNNPNWGLLSVTFIFANYFANFFLQVFNHCGPVRSYGGKNLSAMAKIMASCLMTLDHYLDQCRLIISEVPWYSPMVLSCISSLKIILSKLSSQLVDINTLKALYRRCREKSACHYITCKFHAQSCSNLENNHFIPSVRVNWVTIYYF